MVVARLSWSYQVKTSCKVKREKNESGTAERGMPSENEWNTEQSDSARDEKSGARNLDGDRDESPRDLRVAQSS